MEKYSKHLESLVADRTEELIVEQNKLIEEQKKTTMLLYSEQDTTGLGLGLGLGLGV